MSLRKPGRQTDLEIKNYIDTISPSFCAAKWYNATIWLGSGMSTSCHHPPAHYVHVSDILENPKALHNTPEKKDDRRKMLAGKRPMGCDYCWILEDSRHNIISDRVYKTVIYTEKEIDLVSGMDYNDDINLITLEIAFDRTCNLSCSYCNPAFSTSWVKDITVHGPYKHLISDGRNHYTHTHDNSQRYAINEPNPYVEAFFKWWETDLHKTLEELRITGGEPLMSVNTWRLLDWFESNENKSTTRLAINSNLCNPKVEKFIERTQTLSAVKVYTSCESMREHAEYIRNGFQWGTWVSNIFNLLENGNIRELHIMCTINALCLVSLPQFLSWIHELKQSFTDIPISFTLNILRFPSFQSPLILPDDILHWNRTELQWWLDEYKDSSVITEMEINHVQRLINYLEVVKKPHSEAFELDKLRHDFKEFYIQYDQRNNKSFTKIFPDLVKWYNSI